MVHVVLLGFGNVNSHLCNALHNSGRATVVQVFNRNPLKLALGHNIPSTSDLSKLVDADVYIIGVPDNAISGLSARLPLKDKLVVHVSGGAAMGVLAPHNRRGVFYPLQTFSKGRPLDFQKIPICIEAEVATDLILLEELGRAISENVVQVTSEKRAKLHLAAVFVNNFVNHLYEIGSELLQKEDLPFELLKPLIAETASKIETLSPQEAQTGPAKRKDTQTIEKHLHLLEDNKYKEIYKMFSRSLDKK